MSKRGRESFSMFKGSIYFVSTCFGVLPFGVRRRLLEFFRSTKGKKGLAIRYVLVKSMARFCGDNVSIFPDVYLLNIQNISFGNNVSIHPMCYLEGGADSGNPYGLFIGNDVSIAHGCTLIPGNHVFDELNVPIKDQGLRPGTVRISDNVWLGAKAVILPDVTVASGCVVAAGAVVTRSTQQNSLYGGVPAKLLRKRI